MGQYYKPIILNNSGNVGIYAHPHKYDNGMKLMEHSYIGNSLVGAIEYMIEDDPANVVWAGDYADAEVNSKYNLYDLTNDNGVIEMTPKYYQKEKKKGYEYIMQMFIKTSNRTRYIINHSQRKYVDKTKLPIDNYGWSIHPLPLLTAEGNQRGGGDYYGNNENLVGSWARDFISVSTKKPNDDYTEIIPNFMEDGVKYKKVDELVSVTA